MSKSLAAALVFAAAFAITACSSSSGDYCSSAASYQSTEQSKLPNCEDAGFSLTIDGGYNQAKCETVLASSACTASDRTNLNTAASAVESCYNGIATPTCALSSLETYETAAENCVLDAGAALTQVSATCQDAFTDAGL